MVRRWKMDARSKQEYKKRNITLMDYDNGFILQKTMVSSNRSVDWSLLNDGMTISVSACAPISCITRSQNNDSTNIIIISPRSSSARLLPSGRKNYHRIIHKNNPHFNRKNQKVDVRRESQVRVWERRCFETEVV